MHPNHMWAGNRTQRTTLVLLGSYCSLIVSYLKKLWKKILPEAKIFV